MKIKIALYLNNRDIPSTNFKKIELGNPGVGYSEYLPVALAFYLKKYYGNDYHPFLFLEKVGKMPDGLNVKKVKDISDAAILAKKLGCEVFIFRTRINEEKFILNLLDELQLKSIGVAQLTPSPEHIRALSKCQFLKALVCVGKEQYDSIIDTKAYKKLVVLNNAVETKAYDGADRLLKDPNLVTYLGALTPQKGFHILAQAWPEIIKKCPEAKLSVIGSTKIYGEGRPTGRFKVASEEYEEKYIVKYLTDSKGKLLPSVTLHGQMGHEKNNIIMRSSVGVANPTGQTETCCVSALEFSAAGTAVVSGAYYALLNSVQNNITGLLGKTHKDLAANISKLIKNPELAFKMGKAGREYIHKYFSFEAILPQWHDLLSSVLLGQAIKRNYGPTRHVFKHRKFLRLINYPLQVSLGNFMDWPSIQELEGLARKILVNIKVLAKLILKKNHLVYSLSLGIFNFFSKRTRQIRAGQKAEALMLQTYLQKILPKKNITFIQVGANDGISSDPLRKNIIRYKWKGLLIEPVPYVFEKLKKLYSRNQNIRTINVAISDKKISAMKFYCVSPDAAKAIVGIPKWCDQLGSFDRANITRAFDGKLINYIEEIEVETTTIDDCIDQNKDIIGNLLDLLHIDAEGHDLKVLMSLNLKKYTPRIIMIEHKNLSQNDRASLLYYLKDNGYQLKVFKYDLIALRN